MAVPPLQIVIDPDLREMPETRIPTALIESLKIGISLLKIEITCDGVRSALFASDGSGYEKDVEPDGENFKIYSRYFDTERRMTISHTQVVKKECCPNTRTLQYIIATLRKDIEVDHLVYNTVYSPDIRYTPRNVKIHHEQRMQYCSGMFYAFSHKERTSRWGRLKVKKFSVEFDGTKRCGVEVQSFMKHIQLIGPKEIVFSAPPDRPEPCKLIIEDIHREATWRVARKFTMGEGLYVDLDCPPTQFLHFVQCSLKISRLSFQTLKSLLLHYNYALEFESMEMVVSTEQGSEEVGRVMNVPTSIPYERVSKTCVKYDGRLLCDHVGNKITIVQVNRVV